MTYQPTESTQAAQSTQPDQPILSTTERTRLVRKKDRGARDRQTLYDVLDEGLVCHLGLVLDEGPFVLPTGYGRDGDTMYLHGSTGAHTLRQASTGVDVCVTVTLTDAIVYSRSRANHSMNYRSAIVRGQARPVTGTHAKTHALHVLTEHLAPGSWEHTRDISAKEFASVAVLALDLTEASVKVRAGGPGDDNEDVAADRVWAGILPIHTGFGAPLPSEDLPPRAIPEHVATRAAPRHARAHARVGPTTGSR